MATAAVTYDFEPDTDIKSSEVDTNFADLVGFVNANMIQKDASVAFTGTPTGPATDPVSDNQYARKAYVDQPYSVVSYSGTTDGTGAKSVFNSLTDVSSRGVTVAAASLTIVTAGVYEVGVQLAFASNTSGTMRNAAARLNNGNDHSTMLAGDNKGADDIDITSGFACSLGGVTHRQLQVGDVIDFIYSQDSGSSLNATLSGWVRKVPGA